MYADCPRGDLRVAESIERRLMQFALQRGVRDYYGRAYNEACGMMNVVAIILARGGSKRLRQKTCAISPASRLSATR